MNNRELDDRESDFIEIRNVLDQYPEVATRLRAAYDLRWQMVQPRLIKEHAAGPKINPPRSFNG